MKAKRMYAVFAVMMVVAIMLLLTILPACKPTPPGQPVTLKFSHYMAITHLASKAIGEWAAEIKEKSKGQITIEVYPAGQLYSSGKGFDPTAEGAIQLVTEKLSGQSGKIPVTAIYDLPYIFNSSEGLVNASKGGLDEIMNAETEKMGVKVISVCFIEPAHWFSTKKLLKLPEDFKGQRLRVYPGYVAPAVEAMGGSAVTMPLSDVYTSLQKGIVDGHIGTFSSYIAGKYYEVEKYAVIGQFGLGPIHIMANLKTWNGLSKSQQDLISKTLEDMAKNLAPKIKEELEVTGPAQLREKGVEVYIQKPEDIAKFKAALGSVTDSYLKTAGPLGEKALEIVRKYNK